MKKTGFTLVEVLAVITLIAALSLLILPTIVNQINKSEGKISEATEELLKTATYNYIDMNQNQYPMKAGAKYCIQIQTLIDYGFVKEPIYNASQDTENVKNKEKELHQKYVQASFSSEIDVDYQIVTTCS